ncbi:phage protein Gp36 family protein [Epibacterium ulvae]|uniref:phage protein Gp36 family protein n=1 Tax=Epibacterium ulvae TaxID=1156985 RepID=UPI002490FAC2|nr:phage protein Gp36 family protein [Epibacterium ulvae]
MRFLTVERFIELVGDDEAVQIAGDGLYGAASGAQIVPAKIEAEIAFVDELVAGYVLARHRWLAEVAAEDMPNLLQGLASDIVRYRLRDKEGGQGQVTKTVESRHADALHKLRDIQAGRLDITRDQQNGTPLAEPEVHGGSQDLTVITGPAPSSGSILQGY